MPRDGSEIYVLPFPDVEEDTTIESTVYNGFTNDVAQDLNSPRPIIAGGTGANNVAEAMQNLGGELAKQVITNYDSDPFQAGSFYSDGSATGAPVAGHAFAGICYVAVVSGAATTDMFLEATDRDDTAQPGAKYLRQKKANVWSIWAKVAGVSTGTTPPAGAGDNALWWDPTLGKLFVYYNDGNTKQWVETNAVPDVDPSTYVEIAGDTMTGPLTLNADPVNALHAAPKQYVVAKAGDTMTGNLIINKTNPQLQLQKAAGSSNLIVGLNPVGLLRWAEYLGNSAPEGGGNAGSDWALQSYNDAGAPILDVLKFERATSRGTFGGPVTISEPITNVVPGKFNVRANLQAAAGPLVGNVAIADNFYGMALVREGYHDGSMCLAMFQGVNVYIVYQTSTSYSANNKTPVSGQIGLAWDAATSTWRAYSNFSGGIAQTFFQVWGIGIA